MKRFRLACFLLAMCLGFTACTGASTEEGAENTQTESTDGTSGESSSDSGESAISNAEAEGVTDVYIGDVKVIGSRKSVNGKMQSYLTGEWKDESVVTRRPMAVMIPNNKAALPQYGISQASIVYEAPMEYGSCTRVMGIFEDYDALDHIGPVRSSRLYFLYEALGFDAIYCNWGLAVPYVGPLINTELVDNISAAVTGIDDASDEAFERDEARKAAGYATEYTGIMSIDGYESAVERHEYSTTRHSTYDQGLQFADDGYSADYDGYTEVTYIYPGGKDNDEASGYGDANPCFVYEDSDGLYHRYQYDDVQVDEYNNEELAYTNVIIKFVDGEYVDDNGYLGFRVHGEGDAVVFTNGKCIYSRWSRAEDYDGDYDTMQYERGYTILSTTSATHYYEKNDDGSIGNEVVLNPGKTWICLVWQDYARFTSFY